LIAVLGLIALVAGFALATPSALAQPVPAPPPAPAPVDPRAVPPAPAPVDPLAVPPAPAPPPGVVPPVPGIPGLPPAAPAPLPPSAIPPSFPPGSVPGQDATPFVGVPPFRPPTFNPINGAMVGVAKPIIINFEVPIVDRPMAEQAVHISSNPPVPGRFYWTSDTQLRWRPQDFWPAHSTVFIDAAGTKSSFRTGDALVATIDDNTLEMEVMRNGELEKTFPVSMGMKGHDTKNGTYYVLEKFKNIVMDSSTYGVPVDSANGYKVDVQWAVRIDNQGNFVHSAPWSVDDQGVQNVSHGCINLSPANARWFYDNFGSGDPIVIKNSVGIYNQPDGASDWQMF